MVFAFDLHNVILLPDRKKMLNLFWQARHQFGWKIFFNPYVLYNVYLILKNKGLAEPLFEKAARRHPLLGKLKPLFIDMIDCQIINQDVIDVIKSLKKQGFRVYLATNLWTAILPDLKKLFPDVLSLFDALYFPSDENGNVFKPHPEFYTDFMRKFGVSPDQIVFIDDDRANIKAAYEVGWRCILYKNVYDFKKQVLSYVSFC